MLQAKGHYHKNQLSRTQPTATSPQAGPCSNHMPTTNSTSVKLYVCKHKSRGSDWTPANVGCQNCRKSINQLPRTQPTTTNPQPRPCSNHMLTPNSTSAKLYICKHKAKRRDWAPANVGCQNGRKSMNQLPRTQPTTTNPQPRPCSNHMLTPNSTSAKLYICKHKARRRDLAPANVGRQNCQKSRNQSVG